MNEYTNGHYYSLNQYLRETFGGKVYKIALSGGFTCPNRDGTIGTRGCIFCSEGGSGEFAADRRLSVTQQIEQAKLRVRSKTKDNKFIAYFQTFTSTYMASEKLEAMLLEAVSDESICAVSAGTRPDCLPDDILDVLARINRIKPVWAELGLQTSNERTARYIRRGYSLSVYEEAAEKLKKLGINVITHVIIGLPGETREDMLSTVSYAGRFTDGIKLQLLHVLKNTDLASEYEKGAFSVLSQDEYISIICDCIEVLPKNVVIHRLTGDGDKKLLIAPLWSGNKKVVLNALNKELERRNIYQGSSNKQ